MLHFLNSNRGSEILTEISGLIIIVFRIRVRLFDISAGAGWMSSNDMHEICHLFNIYDQLIEQKMMYK